MNHRRRLLPLLLLPVALLVGGCSKSPRIGGVQGQVTMDGKPLDMVRVLFMPDPHAGTNGAHSESVTNDRGEYQLTYSKDARRRGAIVGTHRVVIEDIAAEESRDQFRPIRVPDRYRSPVETPLQIEVQPGDQVIDLTIEPDKPPM